MTQKSERIVALGQDDALSLKAASVRENGALRLERGYPAAVLETDDFRIPAIRSYMKLGFVPVYDVRGEDHRARWSKVTARRRIGRLALVSLPWSSVMMKMTLLAAPRR